MHLITTAKAKAALKSIATIQHRLYGVMWVLFFVHALNAQERTEKWDFEGNWKIVTVEFNGQERTENHPFSLLVVKAHEFSIRDKQGAEFSFVEFIPEQKENGYVFRNPENSEQSIRFEWQDTQQAVLSGSNYTFYLERE